MLEERSTPQKNNNKNDQLINAMLCTSTSLLTCIGQRPAKTDVPANPCNNNFSRAKWHCNHDWHALCTLPGPRIFQLLLVQLFPLILWLSKSHWSNSKDNWLRKSTNQTLTIFFKVSLLKYPTLDSLFDFYLIEPVFTIFLLLFRNPDYQKW